MEFNFKRFTNWVRRDLIINKKYVLFAIGALFIFLFGVAELAYYNNEKQVDPDFWYSWWLALFIGGGLIFTAMVFWEFKSHAGRIQFLSLPASNSEKTISRIIYTALVYPIVITAVLAAVYFISGSIHEFPSWSSYSSEEFTKPMNIFYLLHAFIFIWSIAFNRYVIPKTIFIAFLTVIVFGFLMSLGFRVFFFDHFDGLFSINRSYRITGGEDVEEIVERWLLPLIIYGLPIFFWVVAFFKMKEKEA